MDLCHVYVLTPFYGGRLGVGCPDEARRLEKGREAADIRESTTYARASNRLVSATDTFQSPDSVRPGAQAERPCILLTLESKVYAKLKLQSLEV